MGDADAGSCTSYPFTVIHINQIDCTAGTFDKSIGDRSFCSTTDFNHVLHTVYIIRCIGSIIYDCHIFNRKV